MTPARSTRIVVGLLWLAAGATPIAAAQAGGASSGEDLYQAACAACHGPDGRGASQGVVGFDVPIPDFTDCAFATPEADADWMAVAHSGGPVRAFDRRMPAFGEALSEAELSRILGHIRTFCTEPAWPRGELNLPRVLVTEKAFPENEAVLTTTIATGDPSSLSNRFLYEQRIGARSQVEITVPIDFRETSAGSWSRGIGDLAAAVKRVLYHSLARGSILSAAGEVVLPTGDHDEGLGRGAVAFEPYVAFGQLLPDDSFLQLQGGLELSANTERASHEAFWRVAVGRSFFEPGFGRAWAPAVELLASRALEDGARVQWDLLPQMQVTLSRRQHVMASAGVQVPLNDRGGRSTRIVAYLLWDWFDGGFLTGWR